MTKKPHVHARRHMHTHMSRGPCWHPAAAANKPRGTTAPNPTRLALLSENNNHRAPLRPSSATHRAWGQLQLASASCSRPAAARPLPVQARAERGPGPWRHQHRQRREGRPRQLGTSPIYSRCKRMGRARTIQDNTRVGADEPIQTRNANRTTPVSLFQFRVNIHGVTA